MNEIVSLQHAIEQALTTRSPSGAKDARYYARKSYAENTYRAYKSDLKDFIAWTGIPNPLPTTSELIKTYLVERAESLSPSTLEHRLAALSFIHRVLNYGDPTQDEELKAVLRGIKRDRVENGWAPNQAPAFTLTQVVAMVRVMGGALRDLRDRAYLLVGVFGAFRQSEMTTMARDQLKFVERGLVIKMGATKGDPLNEYRTWKAIPKGQGDCCPVTALEAWLDKSAIKEGFVFRGINRHGTVLHKPLSHTSSNQIIKRWAVRAGVEAAERCSGHSLRASFITVARELKIPDYRIALQSHHRDLRVINDYYRPEMAFEQNPAEEVMTALKEIMDRD